MMEVATRTPTLLVDTNLLLLLVIGLVDRYQIERFKRTRAYTIEDYDLLVAFTGQFSQIVVTPNILTEVSNLIGQLKEPLRAAAFQVMAKLIGQVEERYRESSEVSRSAEFQRLGLADAATCLVCDPKLWVLTDDLDLYVTLLGSGVNAVNFNHVRAGAWSCDSQH